MNALKHLFKPLVVGEITVVNRIWMAPMTRCRAGQPGDVPTELMAKYYAQRASAGLIITEATQISKEGQGYIWTPGIYTDAQEEGWRRVVEAVHQAGGKIALQLWHVGRISHHLLQEGGKPPVAPSPIQAKNSKCFVLLPDGTPAQVDPDVPRELSIPEIHRIIGEYAAAAKRAMRAGFDLVEIHCANGYLPNQFLDIRANQRKDQYGGSLQNRARFVLEVVDAVCEAIGNKRVGVRLSPKGIFCDMTVEGSMETNLYVASELGKRSIAYLHIVEPDWAEGQPLTDEERKAFRESFPNVLVFCSGYTAERAESTIASGIADAIAFGRLFIANPDLPERFRRGALLNVPDPSTFYGGEEKGYTDYPTIDEQNRRGDGTVL
ncbi:alkene reductase [Candidatus Methylacidiphilum fumarolicum]|uniref:N-ethylmaleimide reductase n=2 Tax=Candidatus Methylacidiphilum fumarolicum TaxID=591154 RepID=I0JZD7_METFB|nr:alkene reductase [Candidatus Methylacidiphilum fumarolicum]MBW6415787.1 alkene reductase [Candidatus Methylacidiphilum fumarolicum]TFE65739.1 alkene reductase [Candidatus Methylacidiphilum fumarolicum]TFE72281.1 alkene reductase [Candidatus Methylacidiphilum fumarolicum]TFE72480.1 alkene reductase [Candidatus Methylacidiphilum fumarolicum]TFE77654.1 alkene reductase [Candidatus Methylacidiphilum fumarolicum]